MKNPSPLLKIVNFLIQKPLISAIFFGILIHAIRYFMGFLLYDYTRDQVFPVSFSENPAHYFYTFKNRGFLLFKNAEYALQPHFRRHPENQGDAGRFRAGLYKACGGP
jgi:hypothetical protein